MHSCYNAHIGGEVMPDKTIAIRIDESVHRQIKIRLAEIGMTLKDYILTLVENDLKESAPLKMHPVSIDDSVNEDTVKQAQKLIDFVNDVIREQNGKK